MKGTGTVDFRIRMRFWTVADAFVSEDEVILNATYADWTKIESDVLAGATVAKADIDFLSLVDGDGDLLADQFSLKES